ncbi:hypothetical protein, partial [Klebsiella pneumoniae]|uniref:hypothetical protein n=1 Tax=Klebsiella pneumoniae TaxID=573 RepID=UPI001330DA22
RQDRLRFQLETMEDGREIVGDFRLLAVSFQDSGMTMIFREESFSYTNPFLEILHRSSGLMTEEEFLRVEWVARSLPEMARVKITEKE